MNRNATIVIRLNGRIAFAAILAVTVLIGLTILSDGLRAQKPQESYRDKFNIADDQGGVAVATSADGKHVYVAGPQGVIVSEDFGKTGTWVQTVRLK